MDGRLCKTHPWDRTHRRRFSEILDLLLGQGGASAMSGRCGVYMCVCVYTCRSGCVSIGQTEQDKRIVQETA